ncbi:SAM-dependent methyltransferase [Corynebacterium lipophiloflavum]|uniref:Cyclopropane-fatty-acyl-phospholipid synthase n=1 Tax=Corynebacterium lipophiloflavum (strain ATCC 700352 / DSM 44291 / CCUG 37336 / JCM 10383 / DMMZ 1944) TaxID=525263 RepID=C0XT48_CORLD|nr:class I SAM-dependent methyltransferase [Corynebacterium lipophiloflavum]EEI16587.1 Cyclopropane-fatty-acyl-phospholipid synthase [Corynebacterium lipophiloflavum DSM 44291]
MLTAPDVPEHLATVDTQAWPGLLAVPSGPAARIGARVAEAKFASACAAAEIELDPQRDAHLVVEHDMLFRRIADSGWVGLAEGFMAGEWAAASSEALVDVLVKLLQSGYRPKTPTISPKHFDGGGEIPAELVQHFAGDGMSGFAGHFATGVPTTQRVRVKSQQARAGRASAGTYFVDVTEFSEPIDASRGDLSDVQQRSVEMLLDACATGRGTHVLEFPSSGGAVSLAAARRGAVVDAWAADEHAAGALRDRVVYAGVGGAVHVALLAPEWTRANKRRSDYDAVVSVERLETLAPAGKAQYLSAVGHLVDPGGRAALQTVMRTEAFTPAADAALQSLRAYIWPGLSYSTPEEVVRIVDRRTPLRVVAQTRAPAHLAASLRLQREMFDSRLREAAADGFDQVYRRLWQWQFALREALARLEMLDVVQVTLVSRDRRGRR